MKSLKQANDNAVEPAIWHLYMIRVESGQLYTGITTDVERRLAEHRAGRGAKYLRGKGRLELVFTQNVGDHSSALKLEIQVKKMSKAEKEALINRSSLCKKLL